MWHFASLAPKKCWFQTFLIIEFVENNVPIEMGFFKRTCFLLALIASVENISCVYVYDQSSVFSVLVNRTSWSTISIKFKMYIL